MKPEIKHLDNSEVEIIGEIPFEDVAKHKEHVIKELGKNFDLPGFRKGHVPEKVLVEHIGDLSLLQEMAQHALQEAFPKILMDNSIDAIGRPEVSITKLAEGNPLGFTIKVAVMPEVKIGDYKKIAAKHMKRKEEVTVEDKEIAETIKEIQRMRAASEKKQEEMLGKKDDEAATPDTKEAKEGELPELTDEFVKTLGDFKDVAEFNGKLKENIKLEKTRKLAEKRRLEIIQDIIKDSKITLPHILIEAEQDKMIAQLQGDVERMGMKFDDYLAQVKKTEADIRTEIEKDADNRARFQLILNTIAAQEDIHPPKDALEAQSTAIMEQHKDADKDRVRIYVATMLTNEEVFKFLEGKLKEKQTEKEKTSDKKKEGKKA